MGYGPDLIAHLLEAERIQPPRSRWSANAVRRIGERRGITWRGMRSFVREGVEAGREAAARESLPRSLDETGPGKGRRVSVVSTAQRVLTTPGIPTPGAVEAIVFRHNGRPSA